MHLFIFFISITHFLAACVWQDKGLTWQLLGIACFFVLIKFLSTNFALQARVFLLHLANGGLMQLLWLWREERDKSNGEVYSKDEDASLAKDGGDWIIKIYCWTLKCLNQMLTEKEIWDLFSISITGKLSLRNGLDHLCLMMISAGIICRVIGNRFYKQISNMSSDAFFTNCVLT